MNSNLAASTVNAYRSIINRMIKRDMSVLSDAENVISYLRSSASPTSSIDTQNSYINSFIWWCRSTLAEQASMAPELRTPNIEESLKLYQAESARLKVLRDAKSKSQTLPESKMDQFVDWTVIQDAAHELSSLTPEEHLMYLLYTAMPPLRADFTRLSLVPSLRKNRTGNFIVKSKDLRKWKLVLQEYKTASKFGKQVIVLPLAISNYIYNHYQEMFTHNGKKYPTLYDFSENTLSKKVSALFEKLTGKRMSINLLRHSYIKHFLSVPRTIVEKEKLAAKMLHSTDLQEKYNLMDAASEEEHSAE